MSDIKLSICIATLNRADVIGQTLNSILTQITDEVEIVIIDGASEDATPDIVREFQSLYNCIRYIRLDKKGGVDADYNRAVHEAKGDYCWLFSDDDILIPGALESALTLMKEKTPFAILVNASLWDQNLTSELQESRFGKEVSECYKPADSIRFFRDMVMFVTFIGCVVIQRDYWLKSKPERFYGSEFIHLGVLYHRSLPGNVHIIREPLIHIRCGVSLWKPRQFRIWLVQFPDLIKSFEWLPKAEKLRYLPVSIFGALKQVMKYRANGALSASSVFNKILPLRCSIWVKLWSVMFIFVPRKIVVKVVLFYFSRTHPDSKTTMVFDTQ